MHRYLTPEIDGEGRNSLAAQLPSPKASISDKPPISSAQYVLALALDLVAKEAQFNRFFGALAGSLALTALFAPLMELSKGFRAMTFKCFGHIHQNASVRWCRRARFCHQAHICPLCQTVYARSKPVRP